MTWNNSATIGASWELDLFGRQRAALDTAIGQLQAGRADAQAARVLRAANVASGYVNLARLVEAQALALVRQRISAGLDTTVDLRQAEGFIAQSRAERESLGEAIVRARHALATLAPRLAPAKGAPLPDALPADLLGRRADLVAQRWRVEAATKDVDVARAHFYPNINLTAFIGLSSLGLDRFINAGSETCGIGPALRLPIFDGGRLRANLGEKQVEVDVAIEGDNAALLRALREVAAAPVRTEVGTAPFRKPIAGTGDAPPQPRRRARALRRIAFGKGTARRSTSSPSQTAARRPRSATASSGICW